MSIFVMPSLGADMEAGTLVEQLVAPGEPVKRGDVIAAVETQKGVIEVEVFEDGILEDWLVDLGSKVPVGAPLANIRGQGEPEIPPPQPPEVPEPAQPAIPPEPVTVPPVDPVPEPLTPEVPQPPAEGRLRVTPAARRLAAERGFDLAELGLDPARPITRAEVERLTADKPAAPTDMRSAIAAAMSRSKREIPHYYLSHRVDLTKADKFVSDVNANLAPSDRLLLGALYVKAVARALHKYGEFNGHYSDGQFTQSEAVHLGLAIHIRSGGLVAPALFDADSKPLDTTMTDMRDLVERVRAGRFKARELSDATITLSSLGDRGVDQLYGVIYPPQVAIVGIGIPQMLPAVFEDKVVPRLSATLTLSADHRVSDGHRGALFLRAIDKALQTPEEL